jgi:hypothetical protein
MSQQNLAWLRVTGGLAVVFAIATYRYDTSTALAFVASCLAGWLNVFGILHAGLAALRREPLSLGTWVALGTALVLGFGLALSGYWLLLALTTSCILLIDAVVLRFSGPPIGYKGAASEP